VVATNGGGRDCRVGRWGLRGESICSRSPERFRCHALRCGSGVAPGHHQTVGAGLVVPAAALMHALQAPPVRIDRRDPRWWRTERCWTPLHSSAAPPDRAGSGARSRACRSGVDRGDGDHITAETCARRRRGVIRFLPGRACGVEVGADWCRAAGGTHGNRGTTRQVLWSVPTEPSREPKTPPASNGAGW